MSLRHLDVVDGNVFAFAPWPCCESCCVLIHEEPLGLVSECRRRPRKSPEKKRPRHDPYRGYLLALLNTFSESPQRFVHSEIVLIVSVLIVITRPFWAACRRGGLRGQTWAERYARFATNELGPSNSSHRRPTSIGRTSVA